MVGFEQPDPSREAECLAIFARELERFGGDVGAVDPRTRKVVRAGERDAAAAGPEIENPPHASRIDPRTELLLD